MSHTPLVSVMIPCFNAAATLPMALTSLLRQTYPNWECVVVDDGSTDGSHAIAFASGDERIRCVRLPKNLGRGVARQIALDHTRGDLICMIDADDWILRNKIRRQVDIMNQDPGVAVCSTGMYVVDADQRLVGCRGTLAGVEDITHFDALGCPRPLPIAHAPSMLRAAPARRCRYDPSFRFAQDADFLLQLIMEHRFCVANELTYVYAEVASVTVDKVLCTLACVRGMFWKYRRRFPFVTMRLIGAAYAKTILYRVGANLGLWSRIIRSRSRKPSSVEYAEFERERDELRLACSARFTMV